MDTHDTHDTHTRTSTNKLSAVVSQESSNHIHGSRSEDGGDIDMRPPSFVTQHLAAPNIEYLQTEGHITLIGFVQRVVRVRAVIWFA